MDNLADGFEQLAGGFQFNTITGQFRSDRAHASGYLSRSIGHDSNDLCFAEPSLQRSSDIPAAIEIKT